MISLKDNPITRLYELFQLDGARTRDEPKVLGVRNLSLRALGGERAQELISMLRTCAAGVLSRCQMNADGESLIDFARDLPWDWFNWEAAERLAGRGGLCEECYEGTLLELKSELDESEAIGRPLGDDEVRKLLLVLNNLEECPNCGEKFSLEIALNKSAAVREYLLNVPSLKEGTVSGSVWYSPGSMRGAFKSFRAFLDFLRRLARHPIVLFFYEPVEAYLGEFFKILPLRDASGDIAAREAEIASRLGEFTPEVVALYDSLLKDYRREARSDVGDKFYLLPALFLRQKEQLGTYPSHPLFKDGPLRSAVVYAVLAWLGESVEAQDDVFTFALPASGGGTFSLPVRIGFADVSVEQVSAFDSAKWADTLGPLAHDMGKCVGNQHYRECWRRTLADDEVGRLGPQGFFPTLEGARAKFNKLKMEPRYIEQTKSSVELRIFIDSGDKVIRYELTAPFLKAFSRSMGELPLGKGDPQLPYVELNELAKLHLNDIIKRDLLPDEDEDESGEDSGEELSLLDKLETKGKSLWLKLIPDGLKREYVKFRNRKNLSLFIVSDDASFPWELVRPYGDDDTVAGGEFDDKWLAVNFNLSRWITGSPFPASEIALSGICCTADTQRLPAAAEEVKRLQSLAAERGVVFRTPQKKRELTDLLEKEKFGILHFACHGHFDPKRPDTPIIMLPGGQLLEPDDLLKGSITKMISQSRPLVLLNVCHSGRTARTFTGIGGWAKRFIEVGCGAFIGCGWEVNDKLAKEFAARFYEEFRKGGPLGLAVQAARVEVMKANPANSTWLAYYLYGNPGACLTN
jgi:hypothetical protein